MSVAERPFLSDQWYRVADLTPKLAPQVRLERRRGPGGAHYLLFDALTGRSHRLTIGAARLVATFDGDTPFGMAWEDLINRMGETAPTQSEAVQVLSQLHGQDLVIADIAPDVLEREERRGKQDRKLLKQNLMGPLSTRIPLFDPSALLAVTEPLVRPLTGWFGFVLWLAFVIYSGGLALADRTAIANAFTDQVWTAGSIATIAGTYVVIKILHEFGHGWVARRHRVHVPEFGIMLLVFMPVPYVDATEAAKLESRWARAGISSAGIVVETALAGLAFLLWREADPGPWRAVLFNVMLVGGVSTVLVNGNPLLKFDGYFVMTDLFGLPNLAQRANKTWGDWADRVLFSARDVPRRPYSAFEKAAYTFYAPAAFVYRVFLSLTIGLYVASSFFVLGVILAIWSLVLSVGKPLAKGLWHIATSPRLQRTRTRAYALTAAGCAVVLGFLFAVPLPNATWTQGVVRAPQGAEVIALAEGQIETVPGIAGANVAPGTTLVRLANPLSEMRLKALRARLKEARVGLRIAQLEGPAEARLAEIGVEDAAAQLRREEARAADRVMIAGIDGVFQPIAAPGNLVGRHVRRSERVGHVIPGTSDRVRFVALQRDVAAIEEGVLRVEFQLPHEAITRQAMLEGRVSTGAFDLPSPILARSAGGPVPALPSEGGTQRATERIFTYDAILPEGLDAPIGGRVYIKLVHPWQPLGPRMVEAMRRNIAGLIEL